jgi:hypothetical protein
MFITSNTFHGLLLLLINYSVNDDMMNCQEGLGMEASSQSRDAKQSRVCGHCLTVLEIRFCGMRDVNLKESINPQDHQSLSGRSRVLYQRNERIHVYPS